MIEKKSHGVQLLIRAVVKDPEGKVLRDTEQKPAKSFVLQFLMFIGGLFTTTAIVNAKDIAGANTRIYANGFDAEKQFRIDAGINVSTYGIVVGTGDAAEDNEDYKLETQLTQGVGAGNITHGAVVIDNTEVVGANVDLELKRAFTNSTGSTITVKEAGIYTNNTIIGNRHCIIRDVLGAINVPDKCSLTVYYTLRTTV